MTTTSAHPDRLDQFVAANAPHAASLTDTQRSIAGFQLVVSSRSPDYRVDVPALATLTTLLETMGVTEAFVATIHDELVAADGAYGEGAVTVDTAAARAALDRAGVGEAPEPIEFAPTVLYGLPPTSGFVDDPICAANGNMIHADHDLAFPGLAAVLDVRRTYNSLLTHRSGSFGSGITSIFDTMLVAGDDRVIVDLPDGATAVWAVAPDRPGGWAGAGRRLHRVEADDDGWTVFTDERTWYRYDTAGALAGWGLGVARVAVERDAEGRIVRCCEHTTGRRLQFAWADGRVVEITTDDGRTATYTYGASDNAGRLVRVVTECGQLHYEWADGLLASVVDADGVRPFRNEYDDTGRVVRQASRFGRVTTYRYEATGLTVITDQAGTRQAMVHDRRGNLTAVIDADGSAMRITYDHDDRAVRVVERDGATWQHEFDPVTGRLVRRIDPDGLTARWTWDDDGRVRSHTDRAGHTTSYDYAGIDDNDGPALATPTRITGPGGAATHIEVDLQLDRPIAVTDPDGVTMRYEYDRDGQLVATADALGCRVELGYDEAGRLARRVDPLGTVTRLRHAAGRLVAYDRNGDGGTFDYSPAGRITAVATSHENSQLTRGEHGAPTAITDAAGNTVTLSYDEIGNVSAITTADGDTFHQFHDEIGRLVGTADPTGATAHRRYDRAGRMIEFVDAEGRTWRRDVDPWGRTVRAIGPDGAATTYTYHPNGEVATVALHDGRVWASEVDHAGRVTSVTDPDGGTAFATYSAAGRLIERRTAAGRTERIEYDAAGRPVAVTDAAGRRTMLERDAAGRVTVVVVESPVGGELARHELVRDTVGRIAEHRRPDRVDRYAYDAAGRLIGYTDGTGGARVYAYDDLGLLSTATDAAGGTIRYGYDVRGRLTSQTTPGDRTTTFGYDLAGRLTEVIDPAGVVNRLDRDASGAQVAQRIGDDGWTAALDAAGRVTGFTGTDGQVLAEFGYDPSGRLTSASVEGWIEEFGWSATDRRTSVTTPDGVTLIERDADGWTVRVTRSDGSHLTVERDATGRILAVGGVSDVADGATDRDLAGRLLLGADGTAYHYDEASRLARVEHPDGTDTRYEFGPDGLRVREHAAQGVREYRYDAAARLVATTVDGDTTRYDYDDAGRRIAEHHPDGSRTRYRWSAVGRLVAILHVDADSSERLTTISHDAFGRPVRVGEQSVAYDPVTGLPLGVGDAQIVNTPGGAVRSDTGSRHTSPAEVPDGLRVGSLTFLGARVHDAATGQFLSPDPLLPAPGSPGAASPYIHGWHDPVNFVDPSGKRPITREEWQVIREREEQGALGAAWQAVLDDPWGSIAAAAVIGVGAGLMFTPLAPIGGGILIGAGLTAGAGVITGTFDPRQVALGGIVGGAGGGLTQAVRAGALGTRSALAANGLIGAADEAANQALDGEVPNPWDCAVAFGLSVGTTHLSDHLDHRQVRLPGRMAAGGAAGGGSEVFQQVLTGQPVVWNEVAATTIVGTGEPAFGDALDGFVTRRGVDRALDLAGHRGVMGGDVDVYAVPSIAQALLFDETGVIISDAALDASTGPWSVLDATQSSVAHHDTAVGEWFGSEADYAAAHTTFGDEIDAVSGPSTLIELTTDRDAALAAADGGAVLTARVSADSLVGASPDGTVFAPHLLRMDVVDATP